jgi:hypothetical protein
MYSLNPTQLKIVQDLHSQFFNIPKLNIGEFGKLRSDAYLLIDKLSKSTRDELKSFVRDNNLPIRLNKSNSDLRSASYDFVYSNLDKQNKIAESFSETLPDFENEKNPNDTFPEKPELSPESRIKNDNKIRIQLLNELPTTYPYYVQSTAKIADIESVGDFAVDYKIVALKSPSYITEKRASRINNYSERVEYAETLPDRIRDTGYGDAGDNEGFAIIGITIDHWDPVTEKQEVIKVARYQVGNCVINALIYTSSDCKLVFKKYPHLNPITESKNPIYVDHNELKAIAKLSGRRIDCYSSLGSKINMKWDSFGYQKYKKIELVLSNGHASIKPNSIKIDKIIYHKSIDHKDTYQVNVIERKEEELSKEDEKIYFESRLDPPVIYYIAIEGNLNVMHKTFRPSSVTKKTEDDLNTSLAFVFSSIQLLSKKFITDYNLLPIPDAINRSIVKSAEHFIGKSLFKKMTRLSKETDNNKNFASYKSSTNPYYIGFPKHELIAVKGIHPKSAFVVCRILNPPDSFQKLIRYIPNTLITIIKPVYDFLSISCNIIVEYTLISEFSDIDIVEYANSKYELTEKQIKDFRNTIIGYSISGGIKETKKLHIRTDDLQELNQLEYECDQNNLTFGYTPSGIIVDYKNKSSGLFHFHSYILGYALINVLRQWELLESLGQEVIGFNVDSLLYNPLESNRSVEFHDTHIAGWKMGTAKLYKTLDVKPVTPEVKNTVPINTLTLQENPKLLPNTYIEGPAGISKSYECLLNPAYNSCFLTPTRALRDELKKYFPLLPIYTLEKYFQLGKDIHTWKMLRNKHANYPKGFKHVHIDECYMYNSSDWKEILLRASIDGSNVIAIGDPKQICSSINSDPITPEFFIDKKFEVKYITRSISSIARHSFEYGSWLDSLRSKSESDQMVECLTKYNISVPFDQIEYNPNHRIICSTHEQVKKYNQKAKNQKDIVNPTVLVRDMKSNDKKEMYLSPLNPLIWWDKKNMKDSILDQPDKRYEPIYASTIDSFQGKTCDYKLLIDTTNITKREGCLYTAITRTQTPQQILLIV